MFRVLSCLWLVMPRLNDSCQISTFLELNPLPEADSRLAGQSISHLSIKPKALLQASQEPVTGLQVELNPIHTLTSYSFNIHLETVLPSTPRSPKWFLAFRFADWNVVCISCFPHAHEYKRHISSSLILPNGFLPSGFRTKILYFFFPMLVNYDTSHPPSFCFLHILYGLEEITKFQ
jgi:hypothetical protein